MARMKKVLFAIGFASAALSAFGQSTSPRYELGASVGDYIPSSTILRNALGDNVFTLGLTPLVFGRPAANRITPSFNIIGADQRGSNFLLVPVTLGYEYHFGDPTASTIPYARVDAGVCYFNYSIETPGPTINGSRFGETADLEVGVEFLKDIRLSARYYLFSEESGLSFNGLQLNLAIGIIRL
jgi:hypothetical protein